MSGGRPPTYKDEFAKQAEKLCLLGATDSDLANFFEVSVRTINRWKIEHGEFCHALKDAKEVADARVVRSLYQRAVGYETEAVKIFMPANADEPVYAPYRENIQPDTAAAIFWLKNRQNWADKTQSDTTLNAGEGFAELLLKVGAVPVFPKVDVVPLGVDKKRDTNEPSE